MISVESRAQLRERVQQGNLEDLVFIDLVVLTHPASRLRDLLPRMLAMCDLPARQRQMEALNLLERDAA